MDNSPFREFKMSKFTEIMFYILIPLVMYYDMKDAKNINPLAGLILFLGFASFLFAKISVLRKGIHFSFGCDKMSRKIMWFYFSGYVLMIVGYFATFHPDY